MRTAKGRRGGIPGFILKTSFDNKGYRIVCLSDGNKGTTKKVHRLVARAFLDECGKPQVNHKDGDKANARLSNLEWVTPSENLNHAISTGLVDTKERARKAKATRGGVGLKITSKDAEFIREMVSAGTPRATLASHFGIHVMTVGEIVRNEIWAA
jgi:hypothetical protein